MHWTKKLGRWAVLACSGVLFTGFCPEAHAAPGTPGTEGWGTGFEPAPCAITLAPDQVEGQTVRCGYVSVPERHAAPEGRQIRLAVALFEPEGGAKRRDPVVLLAGGPGVHASYLSRKLTRERVGAIAPERLLVLLDQRGVGASQPALECPEIEQGLPDGAARCAARLTAQGVDLAAYNTRENADDVEAVRVRLGFKEINLRGSSYGSRLVLEVLRRSPERVRSATIDSVLPPQSNLYLGAAPSFDRSLRKLFDACAADPACDARYPGLDSAFSRVVADLSARPLTVRVPMPGGGTARMRVDGFTFVYLVFNFLYDPALIETLPAMLYELLGRQGVLLGQAIGASPVVAPGGFSYGMHLSAQCHEDVAAASPEAVMASAASLLPAVRDYFVFTQLGNFGLCAAWPVGAAEASWYTPVEAKVPTLLLSGDFDPATPPEHGEAAAATLKHGLHVVIPDGAHEVLDSSACADAIAARFLDKPHVTPDTACAASGRIEFLIQPPAAAPAAAQPSTEVSP